MREKNARQRPTLSPQKAIPSALMGLTSVFGMVTGITPMIWPPSNILIILFSILSSVVLRFQGVKDSSVQGKLVPNYFKFFILHFSLCNGSKQLLCVFVANLGVRSWVLGLRIKSAKFRLQSTEELDLICVSALAMFSHYNFTP